MKVAIKLLTFNAMDPLLISGHFPPDAVRNEIETGIAWDHVSSVVLRLCLQSDSGEREIGKSGHLTRKLFETHGRSGNPAVYKYATDGQT
jgi:hypothetical protein